MLLVPVLNLLKARPDRAQPLVIVHGLELGKIGPRHPGSGDEVAFHFADLQIPEGFIHVNHGGHKTVGIPASQGHGAPPVVQGARVHSQRARLGVQFAHGSCCGCSQSHHSGSQSHGTSRNAFQGCRKLPEGINAFLEGIFVCDELQRGEVAADRYHYFPSGASISALVAMASMPSKKSHGLSGSR